MRRESFAARGCTSAIASLRLDNFGPPRRGSLVLSAPSIIRYDPRACRSTSFPKAAIVAPAAPRRLVKIRRRAARGSRMAKGSRVVADNDQGSGEYPKKLKLTSGQAV